MKERKNLNFHKGNNRIKKKKSMLFFPYEILIEIQVCRKGSTWKKKVHKPTKFVARGVFFSRHFDMELNNFVPLIVSFVRYENSHSKQNIFKTISCIYS